MIGKIEQLDRVHPRHEHKRPEKAHVQTKRRGRDPGQVSAPRRLSRLPHFAFDDGEREDRRIAPGPQIWAGRQPADLVAKFVEALGMAGLRD
ncbi:hypothetical protein NXC14_PA00167 (plasmid) [Rhizobium sp. NXC14]|nr:hypothetical protein NXC14_PA00167 [Rhizobium sp. NXC14]